MCLLHKMNILWNSGNLAIAGRVLYDTEGANCLDEFHIVILYGSFRIYQRVHSIV